MTQQEFENKVGKKVLPETFEDIHRIYMACRDRVDKDQFCEMWKEENYIRLLCIVTVESESLRESFTETRKRYEEERKSTALILLMAAARHHDAVLYDEAVALAGIKDAIIMKMEHAIPLCDKDREYIKNNIK